MYYKQIEENILVAIGESSSIAELCIEITKEEYDSIIELIQNKPKDTEETVYKLVASTMTYEPFDAPPVIELEEPSNPYGIDDDIYNQIVDDTILELIEQGVIA